MSISRLRIVAYVVCLLLVGTGGTYRAAQAADDPPFFIWLPIVSNGEDVPEAPAPQSFKAGEWHMVFEIARGKPKVTWVGQVWEYGIDDDSETPLAERTLDISADCQVFGAPLIASARMSFDGVDDYVTCDIPDYVEIFAEMDAELAECRCFYTSPPWATANLAAAYVGGVRPVLYHPRLQLEVEAIDPLAKVVAYFTLQFFGGGSDTWESNQFPVFRSDGHQIWGGYNPVRFVANFKDRSWFKFLSTAKFADALKPALASGFWLWESAVDGVHDPVDMPDSFGLGPGSTVYIGHNPTANSYFRGSLVTAVIDPGCRAH